MKNKIFKYEYVLFRIDNELVRILDNIMYNKARKQIALRVRRKINEEVENKIQKRVEHLVWDMVCFDIRVQIDRQIRNQKDES